VLLNAGPLSWFRTGLLLLAVDAGGLVLCFNLAHRISITTWLGYKSWPLFGISLITLVVLYVTDSYQSGERQGRTDMILRTFFAVALSGLVVSGLVYITEAWDSNVLFLRGVLPVALVMFAAWAIAWRLAVRRWATARAGSMRWLLLGDSERAQRVWRDLAGLQDAGEWRVLLSDAPVAGTLEGAQTGSLEALPACAGEPWSGIVVAAAGSVPDQVVAQVMRMRLSGARVYDLTDFYERFMQKVPVLHLRDGWFALSHGFDLLHHNVELKIKRVLDVALALALLVPAAPVMVLVALAVRLDRSGGWWGPALYHQERTGRNGATFRIHKFRTMVQDAERAGARWAEKNDPRVTRVGRFLRLSRLDELPQLWNVIRGEMSFIGPRPERPEMNRRLEQAIPYYDLRHLVKPGITGWAQVMYPYGASVDDALEKLQYDLYYIKNYSLLLDIIIILKTLRVILFGKGR